MKKAVEDDQPAVVYVLEIMIGWVEEKKRIRTGEEQKIKEKGKVCGWRKGKNPKEWERAEVEILHELSVMLGHSQKDKIRWSATFLWDWVQPDESCRAKRTVRCHWIVYLKNESMPLYQNSCRRKTPWNTPGCCNFKHWQLLTCFLCEHWVHSNYKEAQFTHPSEQMTTKMCAVFIWEAAAEWLWNQSLASCMSSFLSKKAIPSQRKLPRVGLPLWVLIGCRCNCLKKSSNIMK